MKEALEDSRSSVRLPSVQASRRCARRSPRPVRLRYQSDLVHSRRRQRQAVSARWICVSRPPRVQRPPWSKPLGRHCCVAPRCRSPLAAHLVHTTYVSVLRLYFSCIAWIVHVPGICNAWRIDVWCKTRNLFNTDRRDLTVDHFSRLMHP